jgi:hypothetical protein
VTVPPLPSGYDVTKHAPTPRRDCLLTVGFDQDRGYISRFLVQLHYRVSADPIRWQSIARMDHNETAATGHDVYREGLHVDIERRSGETAHMTLDHDALPGSRGAVVRGCVEYFQRDPAYFVDVYEQRRPPTDPPPWSDGGHPAPTFISVDRVERDMSQERPAEADMLSLDELTELLAEAEGTTPEEIERGAEFDIAPPWEGTLVDE